MNKKTLEKKKKLTQSKILQTKQIWVKKGELKCLVVHTALKAGNASHWYLDSGCSRHMIGDKSLFSHYVPGREGSVAFGDGNTAKIMGRGIVEIPRVPTLKDVLFVDGLKHNLLSISQICDLGYDVGFSKDGCHIRDKEGIVAKGIRTGDNCYIFGNGRPNTCLITQKDETSLWHQRLGHVNYRNLSKLSRKDLVLGIPKLGRQESLICGDCQHGKQVRASHKKLTKYWHHKTIRANPYGFSWTN